MRRHRRIPHSNHRNGGPAPRDGHPPGVGLADSERSNIVPLAALAATSHEHGDDGRLYLQSADVIIGVDERSGEEFVVYGSALLERSLWGRGQALLIARVSLQMGLGELENLLVIVRDIKGDHDHQPA